MEDVNSIKVVPIDNGFLVVFLDSKRFFADKEKTRDFVYDLLGRAELANFKQGGNDDKS